VEVDVVTLETVTELSHNSTELLVEGVGEADVTDHALLEEGEGTDALGAVDDLVGYNKVARLNLLLQTAHGGESDDGTDTERAESGNVGASGDLMRSDLVVQTVTRQESDRDVSTGRGRFVVQHADRRRRSAPWCVDVQSGSKGEAWQRLQTSTANDGNVDRICWMRTAPKVRSSFSKCTLVPYIFIPEWCIDYRNKCLRRLPFCGSLYVRCELFVYLVLETSSSKVAGAGAGAGRLSTLISFHLGLFGGEVVDCNIGPSFSSLTSSAFNPCLIHECRRTTLIPGELLGTAARATVSCLCSSMHMDKLTDIRSCGLSTGLVRTCKKPISPALADDPRHPDYRLLIMLC